MRFPKFFTLIAFLVPLTLLASCMTVQKGKIVSDEVSEEYVKSSIGPVTSTMMYFALENDFNTVMRLHKESILSSSASESEKQTRFEMIKDFQYEPKRYLMFFFSLREPALINESQFRFEFNDLKGVTNIEKILPVAFKVTTTTTNRYGLSSTDVAYQHAWVLKLKRPFTAKEYPAGKYTATVIYPNGQKKVYEFQPK